MKAKQDTKTIVKFRANGDMGNFYGLLHGGELFKMMDTIAGVCTRRFCSNKTLTKAVNNLTFNAPTKLGEIIKITAIIDYVGKTSMECFVRAKVEGTDIIKASGYFTMVSVNEDGESEMVNETIEYVTDEDKMYRDLAIERRKIYKEVNLLQQNYKLWKKKSNFLSEIWLNTLNEVAT